MDLEALEMQHVRRLQYLSKYGSCQTSFLTEWNKVCPSCEQQYSVPKLQKLCLRSLVSQPASGLDFKDLPNNLYYYIAEFMLVKDSELLPELLTNWPTANFSLAEVLSSHNFQCYFPWIREKFAKVLIFSFLKLLLKRVTLKIETLDVRGAVIADDEDIGLICELINNLRNCESNSGESKRICLDVEVSEDLFDQLTNVLILNPEINPESTSMFQVHLGHFQASEGSLRQGQGIKSYLRKLISFTSDKIQSLCVSNTFLKNAGLRKILSELKLPKYANLVAVNIANNDLDLPNCPMTVDLLAQCMGDLAHLRYLNLSQNPVTKCLEYVLCSLKVGLLDLRLSGCELDEADLLYLMGSIHSKSIVAIDVSENSFEDKMPLEEFFRVFSSQAIAIEAEACGIDSDKLIDIANGFRVFKRLHYLSLVGYWMTVEELVPVVKALCACRSLRTLVLSLPVDLDIDVDDVGQVKDIVHPIEETIEENAADLFVQWI